MHSHSLGRWTHEHVFLGAAHGRNERRTWLVVALTVTMMVAEIIGGSVFGSMALLADGWHMATHAAALGIAGLAYLYARQQARNPRFVFGTGKFGDLAAFASAIVLALIAIQIAYESAVRLFHPVPIAYGEAITIAVLGLAVNLLSAWLLRDDHHHHEDHGITTTGTTTFALPTSMSSPTLPHRCWRSLPCCWRCCHNGRGPTRRSASSPVPSLRAGPTA